MKILSIINCYKHLKINLSISTIIYNPQGVKVACKKPINYMRILLRAEEPPKGREINHQYFENFKENYAARRIPTGGL